MASATGLQPMEDAAKVRGRKDDGIQQQERHGHQREEAWQQPAHWLAVQSSTSSFVPSELIQSEELQRVLGRQRESKTDGAKIHVLLLFCWFLRLLRSEVEVASQ